MKEQDIKITSQIFLNIKFLEMRNKIIEISHAVGDVASQLMGHMYFWSLVSLIRTF